MTAEETLSRCASHIANVIVKLSAAMIARRKRGQALACRKEADLFKQFYAAADRAGWKGGCQVTPFVPPELAERYEQAQRRRKAFDDAVERLK